MQCTLHLFAFVKHTSPALFGRMKSTSIGFQLLIMSFTIDQEFDSEIVVPSRLSSLPTTPTQSLTGRTDRLETESSGTRTTVGDDSDSDVPGGTRPIKNICCVGAGYVGTLRGCMIMRFFLVTYRLITDRRSNCCCHCIQKPAHPSHCR